MSGLQETRFHTLDVFTETRLGGNPLAVVTDASGVAEELMQPIAKELNLSETVFVLPPRCGGTHRLRIFTPARELAFAGHPTIGTAALLAELGEVAAGERYVFEEGVGLVQVEVERRRGSWFAELQTAIPTEVRASTLTMDELAALVSLTPAELDVGEIAPHAASCGTPFLLLRVRDSSALARARPNLAEWGALESSWAAGVFLYALEDGGEVRARMFAPGSGILEDPATGSAAAAFAGFMATQEPGRGSLHWTITQGVEMGRPSVLRARTQRQADGTVAVFVGGAAVRVSTGVMWL